MEAGKAHLGSHRNTGGKAGGNESWGKAGSKAEANGNFEGEQDFWTLEVGATLRANMRQSWERQSWGQSWDKARGNAGGGKAGGKTGTKLGAKLGATKPGAKLEAKLQSTVTSRAAKLCVILFTEGRNSYS